MHFQQLWKDLEITNDDFIRTTQPRHEKRVQALVRRLVATRRDLPRQVRGLVRRGPGGIRHRVHRPRDTSTRAPSTAGPLVRYSETSYFFRLTKWVAKLVEHIEAHPELHPAGRPPQRGPQQARAGRGGPEHLPPAGQAGGWGVPMPNDADPLGVRVDRRAEQLLHGPGPARDRRRVRRPRPADYWPADVHLIGKDILWFHAVYWPCMLMALDLPLPRCVFAHGWWTSEGKKMSKSLGNFISRETIAEICGEYSRGRVPLLPAAGGAFGADGDFSREMLRQRLQRGTGQRRGQPAQPDGQHDRPVLRRARSRPPGRGRRGGPARYGRRAADALIEAAPGGDGGLPVPRVPGRDARAGGRRRTVFIDVTEPFKLAKDESQRPRLGGDPLRLRRGGALILAAPAGGDARHRPARAWRSWAASPATLRWPSRPAGAAWRPARTARKASRCFRGSAK